MPVVVIDRSVPQAQAYLSVRYELPNEANWDHRFVIEISGYNLAAEDLDKLQRLFSETLIIKHTDLGTLLLYHGMLSQFPDLCLKFSIITGNNSLPLSNAVQSYFSAMIPFPSDLPEIMGIVNVTPDSFSDGGRYYRLSDAIQHAERLIDEGATIIDIGGESTRPGSQSVTIEEEKNRVLPVIRAIAKKYPEVKVSVDTTKAGVADAALLEGAAIVNDISGGTFDNSMLAVCSKHRAPIILMHTSAAPAIMQKFTTYCDVVSDIIIWLSNAADRAVKAEVKVFSIDPGIGFGKTVKDNYTLIARLREFSSLGYPVLIGLSRKSFIGSALNLKTEERDNPTMTLEFAAMIQGAKFIRTHNVRNAVMAKELYKNLVTHV